MLKGILAGACCCFAAFSVITYNANIELEAQVQDLETKASWQEETIVDKNEEVALLETLLEQKFSDAALPEAKTSIYKDIDLPKELQLYTWQCCQYFGIDYKLFLSLMYIESSYDPTAGFDTGYVGLCQVSTANTEYIEKELGRDIDLQDPYDNILAGVYWLSRYAAKYPGDTAMQLRCYNMGEYAAKKNMTENTYIDKILSYYLII